MAAERLPLLQRLFDLAARGTPVRTEILAGLTTFITMAYIVVVNPLVLGDAGMPIAGVAAATCVAAGFGCILMGLLVIAAPCAIRFMYLS